MGAVTIETYNTQLMTLADYSDTEKLKSLFRNYFNLLGLAECGDTVAASILIDLNVSIQSDTLTQLQRVCIIGHLMHKSTLRELSTDLNKSESTIRQAISGGIKKIQKALNDGSLYE